MFTAELTVFVFFQSVGVIFFVFHGVIVSLLAFCAGERNSYSHFFIGTSVNLKFSRYSGYLSLNFVQVSEAQVVPPFIKRRQKQNKKEPPL